MNSIEYAKLLDSIKARVRAARLRAATVVNSEVILLYWHVGLDILKRQAVQGWGTKVVDRLSRDLKQEFPDMRGLSPRNLNYMLAFARTWTVESILQQVVAKLPWGQNIILMERVKKPAEREWYAHVYVLNYFVRDQEEGDSARKLERKESFRREYLLSLFFAPGQRDLVAKRMRGEPLTKTEREYFSRVVKKKLQALADPDLHLLAQKALRD